MRTPARHLLTVAIEDYFQVGAFSGLIPREHWPRFESRLQSGTGAVLRLLAAGEHRATFFAGAWVARHHAALLREVQAAGHEVACQTWLPTDAKLFSTELRDAKDALEQALGRAVPGHRIARAGGGWLRESELNGVLPLVCAAGFVYDASVCAIGHQFAGAGSAGADIRLDACGLRLVPTSTAPVLPGLPWRVPVAGGNWFRQWPAALREAAEKRWLAAHPGQPLVAYFHTWEFDGEQPRIAAAPAVQRVRHYRHLQDMPARLAQWLSTRRCDSVAGYLGLTAGPVVPTAVRAPMPVRAEPVEAPSRRKPVAITLVVPCFDESAALPYLARTLHAFAESQRGRLELHHVFIDDGSRDDTAARLHTLARELPNSRVVQHPHNRGIAAALLTGFAASRTELVAVLDADCTFDPAQLPAMLALLTDGVDVVSASPAHAQGSMANVPRWRAALSVGAAALYRHVLRQRLSSCTSCFRLYRRRVLQGLTLSDPGFCGVAEILCRLDMAGARIVEYPARLETRVLGRSKIRVLRTVASHLRLLARLLAHRWWRRPLPTRVQAWQPSAG